MIEKLSRFLIEAEGFERFPYKDSAGNLTIGVGHLLSLEERNRNSVMLNGEYVPYESGLSVLQVRQLLEQDLQKYMAAVRDSVKVEITDNQFTALVSFCFNVGIHQFRDSSLLHQLNNGRFDRVPYELMKWIYADGKIDKGLMQRRTKEVVKWLT